LKFKEVERLWATVPIYPGMVEVNSSSSSTGNQARIDRDYKSDAPLAEIKRFYLEKLSPAGWRFISERELKHRGRFRGERLLEFRHAEYDLDIKYSGARSTELGSDYSITISWHGS
jgi:hypothetical protein